MNIEVSYN